MDYSKMTTDFYVKKVVMYNKAMKNVKERFKGIRHDCLRYLKHLEIEPLVLMSANVSKEWNYISVRHLSYVGAEKLKIQDGVYYSGNYRLTTWLYEQMFYKFYLSVFEKESVEDMEKELIKIFKEEIKKTKNKTINDCAKKMANAKKVLAQLDLI